MSDSLIIGGVGMRLAQSALDQTANNMANIGTVGFKKDLPNQSFEETLAAGPATVDWSEGVQTETGQPLDLALTGRGLFAVKTPQGERYTRDGRLRLTLESGQARLTNVDGFEIQGEKGSIAVDPAGPAVRVDADGTVSQGGKTLDRLRVAWPAHLQDLTKEGRGLYAAKTAPAPVERPDVRQGRLESSNVEGAVEMVGMMTAMRSFEMNANGVKQGERNWERLLQALNGRV